MELTELIEGTREPTVDEETSKHLLVALRKTKDWQWYHSRIHGDADVEKLAARFLRAHCLVPGVAGVNMLGTTPVGDFAFQKDAGWWVRGVYFLNGAVVLYDRPEEQTLWLMVSEETANRWGYPDTDLNWEYINQIPATQEEHD